MKSKKNKKVFRETRKTEYTFFVGDFPGEVKKVRGLFNRIKRNSTYSNIADQTVRTICSSIPLNQKRLEANARGDRSSTEHFDSILKVFVI